MNPTPDAQIDAPPASACTTVPQAGCSGPTPACDAHDDGSTFCRAVTSAGTSNSHCTAETECKAGYTCTDDGDPSHAAWCARFCTTDSHCLGDGSRCINALEDSNGDPNGITVCTNACNPVAQTGCPTGMGCMVWHHASGDFSDCAYMDGKALGASCDYSEECSPGALCVGTSTSATCRQTCVVNGANTCPSGKSCASFFPAVEIGTAVYGVCN